MFSRSFVRTLSLLAIVVTQVVMSPPAGAAPGDLDPTFGIGGVVTTDLGGDDEIIALAIQPNGKIVGAGETFDGVTGKSEFAVVRYTSNGSLDPSFGVGGVVTTDFAGRNAIAVGVALRPDGTIVVCGLSRIGTDDATTDFALAGYTANGALDPTFGSGGEVLTDFGGAADRPGGCVAQADGKVVAGGTVNSNAAGTISDFGLARYETDGSLDQTFGQAGKVVTNIEDHTAGAGSPVLQPDGRIVLGGGATDGLALARYRPDGSLDPSFGTGGIATGLVSGTGAGSLALQPDGKLVAAGAANVTPGSSTYFAVERINADGSLDLTFGTGGQAITDLGGDDVPTDVAIQTDGKIVVAGDSFGPARKVALVRYNPGGSLDPSFGIGGVSLTTPFGDLVAMALQTDGKIVVGGIANGAGEDMALARYQAVPTTPPPLISSFSPLSGPVGTSVSISGTNFLGASTVWFNGTAQPNVDVDPSGTLITATVPIHATTGPISVSTPFGTATSVDSFTVTGGAHARDVTLHLWGHLIVKGDLSAVDGFAACFQNEVVKIQRHGRAGWRTVAWERTDAAGSFRDRIFDRTGTYRARAVPVTLSGGDTCGDAISSVRAHHGHEGGRSDG